MADVTQIKDKTTGTTANIKDAALTTRVDKLESAWDSAGLKQIACGYTPVSIDSSTGRGSTEVTFDKPFTSAPMVTVAYASSTPGNYYVSTSGRKTTGFTLNAYDSAKEATNINVTWIAVQPKS